MGLVWWELMVCMGIVAVGGLAQGTAGFGAGLVSGPIVALVAPEAVPVTLVLLGVPLTVTMALRGRHAIDRGNVGWIVLGRAPGTAIGVAMLVLVPAGSLAAVVGAVILVGVGLSVVGSPLPVGPMSAFGAGTIAGITGTTAAVDGPPLALLYQHATGEVLRATLASAFLVGAAMSVVALGVTGQIESGQVELAAMLLPAMMGGLLAGNALVDRVDTQMLRPAVLSFAGIAGSVALFRGLGFW